MKKHMKGKKIALLAGISTLCLTFPSFAGELVKDTAGTWYRNDDGSYLQNEWHQEGNGDWYFFGKDGYAVTGVMQGDLARYIMDPDGVMYTNVNVQLDSKYYHADEYGILLPMKATEGWILTNNGWIYRENKNTILRSEWKEKNGKWLYLGEDGLALKGWLKLNDVYYYMGADGSMETGWQKVGGVYYYLGDDGIMRTGLQQIGGDGAWYLLGTDGAMRTGWQDIDGASYYFDMTGGAMQTGWHDVEGGRRYLGADGKALKNTEQTVDGVLYVFDANGIAAVKPVSRVQKTQSRAATEQVPAASDAEMTAQVNAMAEQILTKITNASMNKTQKARAIYSWVRSNMRYVNHSEKGNWVKSAYTGFRTKRGDCYTYYSVSKALLDKAGIANLEVIRTDGHHWWSLVDCGNGWYHFDTTPRSAGGTFCLLTDAQLENYSNTTGRGSHKIDHSKYPATPTTPSP